eukprot:scaffold10429_cov126-Cylindrotheca_fusiformis.AAC.18
MASAVSEENAPLLFETWRSELDLKTTACEETGWQHGLVALYNSVHPHGQNVTFTRFLHQILRTDDNVRDSHAFLEFSTASPIVISISSFRATALALGTSLLPSQSLTSIVAMGNRTLVASSSQRSDFPAVDSRQDNDRY